MKLTERDYDRWLDKEHWSDFASSTKEGKKLQIKVGEWWLRVLHGSEIVYEGLLMQEAMHKYNLITKPNLENIPKTN